MMQEAMANKIADGWTGGSNTAFCRCHLENLFVTVQRQVDPKSFLLTIVMRDIIYWQTDEVWLPLIMKQLSGW